MRFALYLKNLDEEYQISVYRGVKSQIEAMGAELICVQNGIPGNSPRAETDLFPAHEFIAADGIMLLNTALFDRIDMNFLGKLRNIFPAIPIVSIGVAVDGYPSIIIESRNTMKTLMEHLTGFHDYNDLLYIGGPAEHEDNKIRETVFREHILSLSSQVPPVNGDIINTQFHETAGMLALRKYITDRKGKPPQAIVAGNDYIAMGALKTISSQSDPVWQNCTVTGFDDIDQAKYVTPALTTIRQPLEELGKIAVQTLAALVKGENTDPVIKVDSHLVIRNSCGCLGYQDEIDLKDIPSRGPQEQQLRNMFLYAQNMETIATREEIIPHLTFLLNNLNVKTFYFIAYKDPQTRIGMNHGEELIYCRIGGKDFSYAGNPQPVETKNFFKTQITEDLPYIDLENISAIKTHSRAWCLYPLRSGGEYLGYLLYEVQDNMHLYICSAAAFITNTLKRLRNMQDDIYRRLAEISMFCKNIKSEQSAESFMPELSGMIDEALQCGRQHK